uniref:Uncharacterized protein n=1 Tax=Poecilia mexicana TaxID=48701 RepID=A0A3B3Z3Z4_9TELE
RPPQLFNSQNFTVDLRMPGVLPTEVKNYGNVFPLSVDFLPHASMDTVHHMLLFGCQTPVSTSSYCVQGTCEDESSIMYAWARNAPPTKLPKDVGFKVGRNSGMSYFVLQIHYGDVSAFRGDFLCSFKNALTEKTVICIFFFFLSVTNADVACDYDSYPIYPFAFRTHTHSLGKVVSGYRIRDGKWSLIGRQSPQLPQAFYPANKEVTVRYGDTVAARCVFSGEGRISKTYIGGTSNDEMCNFYMMYYMDSRHAVPFMSCMETGSKELFQHIPAEANVPIAVSPGHMHAMMPMGNATDDKQSMNGNKAEPVLDQGELKGNQMPAGKVDWILVKSCYCFPVGFVKINIYEEEQWRILQLIWKCVCVRVCVCIHGVVVDSHLEQVSAWPQSSLQLGQVSGLALDSDSNLVIFHRGDHHWGADSFNSQARYQQRSLGPIQQSTILVVDPANGRILKASGRNMFYLPHGITTDQENNYWVTDVALHQVSLSGDGRDRTLLVLGEAFTPGSDTEHFCQPTDVAVDPETQNIFVSDGYCNARILKFAADGTYLTQWGAGSQRRTPFRIPHSLVFLPDRKEVCVADRENGRIQCFIAETGEFVKEIKNEDFGGEVFAITYNGLIFAVNGDSPYHSAPLRGFVLDYSTKQILDSFSPTQKEFKMPHDIVVAKDGSVFVGDAGSNSVFKFTAEKLHRSVKKAGIEVQELEGKAVGTLNLGKFFASHKGYSRQGFDQLSTEGSDQDRNAEDSSDSDTEEYSAPPPRPPPPQSSS